MDKKLLKEIQKLKYLNSYDRGKTLNENKILTEQIIPATIKAILGNVTTFTLEQAIKLNVRNLPEIFGKEIVQKVDDLITKSISKGRLVNALGKFNGKEINLKLVLFRKWVHKGSTELMTPLEKNIFYEALASIEESFNKTLLAELAETAEGKLLKSGTVSEEAFQKMLKDTTSPLYGFSETYLKQISKLSGGVVDGVNKKLKQTTNKLLAAANRFGKFLEKSWKKSGTWLGGTGLFKSGPEISSKIRTYIVEKHLAKLAKYEVKNIPSVLTRLGLSSESVQQVIKAIQQKTAVPSKVMEEIYTILVSRATPELEKIFNTIYKDLTKSKWFKKDIKNYLDTAFLKGTKDLEEKQIKELKKLLGLPAEASDELAIMLMKEIQAGSGIMKYLRKVWYKPGTNNQRFIHWITCKGNSFTGWGRGICIAFKLHLFTSLTPFINEYASIKALWNLFTDSSAEDKTLNSLKNILDPQAAAIAKLNEPTRWQFLQPDKEIKSKEEINTYYDGVAEAIGVLLLTFVPTDAETGSNIFPPWYRENPEDEAPENEIDIDSVYGANTGNGRWYTGPFISELNKATDNEVFQFILASISSDWNNIKEDQVANLLTSRPSKFGIAKVAERYKHHSGRSLWGDLDQLEMGNGVLQNFVNNFLFVGDIDKHNLGLASILRLPEYTRNDMSGEANIVMDPKAFIWDDWWEFPEVLYDQIETEGKIVEVAFDPEYKGYMPLDLMTKFQLEPSWTIESLDGNNTYTFTVETEEDLYDIPAKVFNEFLETEALSPFKQKLYHHQYIYEQEVVGYDANGAEMIQWNRKRNPSWTGTPKDTGVKELVEQQWEKFEEKLDNGEINPGNNTNDTDEGT